MTAVDHADNSSTHTTVSTSDGSATYSKLFFHNLTNLRPSVAPIKELKGPVGQIQHIDRVVLAVEQVLLLYIFQTVKGPSINYGVSKSIIWVARTRNSIFEPAIAPAHGSFMFNKISFSKR